MTSSVGREGGERAFLHDSQHNLDKTNMFRSKTSGGFIQESPIPLSQLVG